MPLDFNPVNHTYKINSNSVPSVTGIISEIVGHGWSASDWYLTRGTAIHKCAELIAQGKNFKFDERLAGYIAAIKKFFAEVKPEIIENEKKVFSQVYQYAGTLDLLCKIGNKIVIVDYKHSVDKIRIPLQLAGYAIAVEEMGIKKVNFGIGVQIKENGTYQMTEILNLTMPRYEFLALRTAYKIKAKCGNLTTQRKV